MLVKKYKIYALKKTKIDIFPMIVLNVDSSSNIQDRLLKFAVVITDMLMEGAMSQILLKSHLLFDVLCIKMDQAAMKLSTKRKP